MEAYNNDNGGKRKPDSGKSGKRMPVWKLILTDILLTCVSLGIFMLYHYVLPRHLSTEEIVVASADTGETSNFNLPGNKEQAGDYGDNKSNSDKALGNGSNTGDNSNSENGNNAGDDNSVGNDNNTGNDNNAGNDNTENDNTTNDNNTRDEAASGNSSTGEDGEKAAPVTEAPSDPFHSDRDTPVKGVDSNGNITNYGNYDTMDITADQSESESFSRKEKTFTQVNSYSSDNIQFTTNMVEVGDGSDKITYYISDVYVTNVKYLKAAFAKGEYGKNLRESTLEQAIDNNALLAINGDYYGNSEIGVVIRNGVLYRKQVYDADLCVLFTDGTMKTYAPDEFNIDDILEKGAWQAWTFGPQLLDGEGNVLTSFNSTYYLSLSHPRTAIGYVEPGHYVFLVVDGRNEGYSRGATLTEMAQMMADAGCVSAYNLDGGQSSEMVYEGEFVNIPSRGGRAVSDIIYVGEE